MTWKQWFKNPDFYKVINDPCTYLPPKKSVRHLFSQPLFFSMIVPFNQLMDQSVSKSVSQSVSQSINQLINQSINQSIN